jgi:tRNA uridine 5-carbamoylmethylation protein Kti12
LFNQNFLICLVGLPASGKTTFANLLKITLKKVFNKADVKIIDPDLIRQKLTSNEFNHKKEYIVRKTNLEVIKSELKLGNIVISDDLNYYSSMRHDLKQIADDLMVDFFIIHIATPFKTCVKWNVKRGEPIPNDVINKVREKFDLFNKYHWDYPIATYDLSENNDLSIIIQEFLTILENKMKQRNRNIILEKTKNSSNKYNENLDKLTRTYVGKLVLDPNFSPIKKKIFKLRKTFIKKNKNKEQSEAEILRSFRIYLEKILKIKLS